MPSTLLPPHLYGEERAQAAPVAVHFSLSNYCAWPLVQAYAYSGPKQVHFSRLRYHCTSEQPQMPREHEGQAKL